MKVNLDGLLVAKGAQGYVLKELATNLHELRERHRKGDGVAALDEFFSIYVFGARRSTQPQGAQQ